MNNFVGLALKGLNHNFCFFAYQKIAKFCRIIHFALVTLTYLELATQRCFVKKVFLKISQNCQENSCARVSLLIKLQASCLVFKQCYKPYIKGCLGYPAPSPRPLALISDPPPPASGPRSSQNFNFLKLNVM